MLVAINIVIWSLSFFSSTLSDQVNINWEDDLDLVKESNHPQLLVLLGGTVNLVCQVNQASHKSKVTWSMDGYNVENQVQTTFTEEHGSLMMRSHLQIQNVTREMDGAKVTCLYSQQEYIEGVGSWSSWPLAAVLNIFTTSVEKINSSSLAVRNRMRAKITEFENILVMNNQPKKVGTISRIISAVATLITTPSPADESTTTAPSTAATSSARTTSFRLDLKQTFSLFVFLWILSWRHL